MKQELYGLKIKVLPSRSKAQTRFVLAAEKTNINLQFWKLYSCHFGSYLKWFKANVFPDGKQIYSGMRCKGELTRSYKTLDMSA